MQRTIALTLAFLLTASVLAVGAGASAPASSSQPGDDVSESTALQTAQSEAFAGAHVGFDVEADSLVGYTVGGSQLFGEVRVQSASETDGGVGVGTGLGAVVDVDGAALSLSAQTETRASITADSGASLTAHDTERGHLVVEAGGESQLFEAQLADGASASADGEAVVVANGEYEGSFVVVGDGEVTVNDEGDVVAEVEGDSTVVFRAYESGERDDEAKAEEEMIAAGEAAAELYVEARDDETVAEAVAYGEETAAEASQEAESTVELTIERTTAEGTVVLTTISEAAVGSIEDLQVAVDGEAAAEASSMSELEAAAAGEEPRYMIASHNEAEATASIYVAIDHFSERTVTMSDGSDDGTDDGTADDDAADDGLPGFGPIAALLALAGAVAARLR